MYLNGEPLWLSGKVVKNEKINEIERTRAHSPPRATSFLKKCMYLDMYIHVPDFSWYNITIRGKIY
jgi:hypothetical protein